MGFSVCLPICLYPHHLYAYAAGCRHSLFNQPTFTVFWFGFEMFAKGLIPVLVLLEGGRDFKMQGDFMRGSHCGVPFKGILVCAPFSLVFTSQPGAQQVCSSLKATGCLSHSSVTVKRCHHQRTLIKENV